MVNINKETWDIPIFGDNWAALCEDKDIIIFNPLTWQEVGVVYFPSNGKIDCSSFSMISDGSAKDVASFEGSTDEKKNGIWIVVLEPGNPEAKLLLNYSDISVISAKKLMVFSYSFRA